MAGVGSQCGRNVVCLIPAVAAWLRSVATFAARCSAAAGRLDQQLQSVVSSLNRDAACRQALSWLDKRGHFSAQFPFAPPVLAATVAWTSALHATQVGGKLLGVSCATPGWGTLGGVAGIATASVIAAQTGRTVSALRVRPCMNWRREWPGAQAALVHVIQHSHATLAARRCTRPVQVAGMIYAPKLSPQRLRRRGACA
jgi:hypothetical protein